MQRLPIFPLGTVLFPGMLLPLHLFEERYRRLMRDREGISPIFGVVLTKQGREVADEPEIHRIGTAAELLGAGRYPDGRYDVVVRGERRFRVVAEDWTNGYLIAEVEWLEEETSAENEGEIERLAPRLVRAYGRFLDAFERTTNLVVPREALPSESVALGYAVCQLTPLDSWERQSLLEVESTSVRLERLTSILRRERDLLLETGVGGATVERPGCRFTAN